ncbi:recombinase family protein [Acetobacterium wieringae]|uniref:recombinase family protein n=1 Tax=Acetobacterium wieringae TaxID=52694 RepID=UPI0026F2FC83|nr:recombinase family protein [Acetobacterium wieringae]
MPDKKAALYIRVSTAMQADRDSLPMQRSDLVNYANLVLGINDYEIFEDAGFSAKNTDRPKYQEMMGRVRNREFSHILVWKIDRISRNLIDFCEMYEEIKKYDTAFISKNEQFDTSSPMGEAMLRITLIFAELERKMTAERVLSVMIDRASKGLYNGAQPPMGYKIENKCNFPVVDESEAEIVRYIFDLYEETRSSNDVAISLVDKGVKTKRGGEWDHSTVINMLRNPFYKGTYRYNYRDYTSRKMKKENEWIVIENSHPAIIDEEQFARVQGLLKLNRNGSSQYHRENTQVNIFSRKLICGECLRPYNASTGAKKKSNGLRPATYSCSGYGSTNPCKGCIGDGLLVPIVFNYISNVLRLSETIKPNMRQNTIKNILIDGWPFMHLKSISNETVNRVASHLLEHKKNKIPYKVKGDISNHNLKITNKIENELKKYKTAILRLEELYLFSPESMSGKDFMIKKSDLDRKIKELEAAQINEIKATGASDRFSDLSFKAGMVLFKKTIMLKGGSFNYDSLVEASGTVNLRQIVDVLIDKIVIKGGLPIEITFTNGLTSRFEWNPGAEKMPTTAEICKYENKDRILKYIDDHGKLKGVDFIRATGYPSHAVYKTLHSLVDLGEIVPVKKENSKVVSYYIKG